MLFASSLYNYTTLPNLELLSRCCITIFICIMPSLLALWHRDLFGLVFKQLDWYPYVYFKLRLVYFTGSSFPDTWKVIFHLFLTLFLPLSCYKRFFWNSVICFFFIMLALSWIVVVILNDFLGLSFNLNYSIAPWNCQIVN